LITVRRLLVGVLALGACAIAPTAQAAPSLNTDAVKVKDYQMTLSVAKSGAAYSLTVMMNRTAAGGKSSQFHIWSFPLSGKAVKLTGKTFKVDTGTELGRYGKVKLTLGQTAVSRSNLPCFGTLSTRRGAVTGSVKLSLDSAYFKNVTKRPTKAGIAGTLPKPKPNCGVNQGGANGGQSGLLTLSAFPAGGALEGGVMVSASKDSKGAVSQSATMMASGTEIAPASSVMHFVSAQVGADGLVAADDLATASMAFASPFLAGNLAFTAMEGTNTPANAFGDLSGSLQVKFDSPGVQTVTALQGSLQRS
jgi:hypothetical protein